MHTKKEFVERFGKMAIDDLRSLVKNELKHDLKAQTPANALDEAWDAYVAAQKSGVITPPVAATEQPAAEDGAAAGSLTYEARAITPNMKGQWYKGRHVGPKWGPAPWMSDAMAEALKGHKFIRVRVADPKG